MLEFAVKPQNDRIDTKLKNRLSSFNLFAVSREKSNPVLTFFQKRMLIAYVSADIAAAQGIVRIQAQTILPATPQRTAVNLRKDPTPIIEPVIVWVVLTGTPSQEARKILDAAADSAQNPSKGFNFATLCPMVFTIRQPPNIVPNAIAA
jgi:hypothetical protein